MLDYNGPDKTSQFFASALSADEAVQEGLDLPGLDSLSTDELGEVLSASADAASSQSDIDLSSVSENVADVLTEPIEPATRTMISDEPASEATRGMAAAAAAPLRLGNAWADGFAWKYADRYSFRHCDFWLVNCGPISKIDFSLITDPGEVRTTTQLNFVRQGDDLGKVTIESTIYSGGRALSGTALETWSTPGYGTQYNYHTSTLGYTFEAEYKLRFAKPYGSAAWDAVFRTGVSAPCSETPPEAYKCKFTPQFNPY